MNKKFVNRQNVYRFYRPTYEPHKNKENKQKNRKNAVLFILAAQVKTNANTIIQEIINIAEMLTDADIALYRIPDCDSAQWHGKPENNIHDMI